MYQTTEEIVDQLERRVQLLQRVLSDFMELARRATSISDVNLAAGMALEELDNGS